METADGWYDLAAKEDFKLPLQFRAAKWYHEALASATGIVKTKVEKRLADLDKATTVSNTSSPSSTPLLPNTSIILRQSDKMWFGKRKKARYWYPIIATKAADAEPLLMERSGKDALRYGQTVHLKVAAPFDGEFKGYDYLGMFGDGMYYWNKTPKEDSPKCLLWRIEPASGSPRKMDADEKKSDIVRDQDRIRLRNLFHDKQFLYPKQKDARWGDIMSTIDPGDDAAAQELCEFTMVLVKK